MDTRQRFLAACTLHACGRLPADEAQWLATVLQQHPTWQADLDQAHTLTRLTREVLHQREADRPAVMSFDEVMAQLPHAVSSHGSAAPAWLHALVAWWQRPSTMGLATAAMAALAVGLGVQTHRLNDVQDMAEPASPQAEAPIYRSGTSGPSARIALHLQPDATMQQVNDLLSLHHLQIVEGPDAQQVYQVHVAANQLDRVLAALRNSPVVLSATRVTEAP